MDNEIKKKLMSIWIVVILCASSLFLLPDLYFSNAPIEYRTITFNNPPISNVTVPYSIYPSQSFDVIVGDFNTNVNFSRIVLSVGIMAQVTEYTSVVYFNATKEYVYSNNGTVQVIFHCSLANMEREDLPILDYIDYGTNELVIFLNPNPVDLFFTREKVPIEINSEEATRMWINYTNIIILATGIVASLIIYRKSPSQPKENDK